MAMTRYTVTAERGTSTGRWVLQCVEYPGAISETKRLDSAPDLMRETIAFVAQVDESDVEIDLQPVIDDEVRGVIAEAGAARGEAETLSERASRLIRAAAGQLAGEGISLRDAGVILGVSYQRVAQLVAEDRARHDSADPDLSKEPTPAFDKKPDAREKGTRIAKPKRQAKLKRPA